MHVWLHLAIAICACPQLLIGLDHLVVLMVPYGLGIDVICIYIKIHLLEEEVLTELKVLLTLTGTLTSLLKHTTEDPALVEGVSLR